MLKISPKMKLRTRTIFQGSQHEVQSIKGWEWNTLLHFWFVIYASVIILTRKDKVQVFTLFIYSWMFKFIIFRLEPVQNLEKNKNIFSSYSFSSINHWSFFILAPHLLFVRITFFFSFFPQDEMKTSSRYN